MEKSLILFDYQKAFLNFDEDAEYIKYCHKIMALNDHIVFIISTYNKDYSDSYNYPIAYSKEWENYSSLNWTPPQIKFYFITKYHKSLWTGPNIALGVSIVDSYPITKEQVINYLRNTKIGLLSKDITDLEDTKQQLKEQFNIESHILL